MRVLVIGGTGLISVGIIRSLLQRGASVTMLNRGQRENVLPPEVERVTGNRDDSNVLHSLASRGFDVVIDMICFNPPQAELLIREFSGHTQQVVFCSTVCSYGVQIPGSVLVDETFPQNPISGYGKNKLACEKLFLAAGEEGKFAATVIRPSSTYGEGGRVIDHLEFDPPTWGRIERGLPVLCAGDGMTLWVSTYRDDCGKLFAYAALNPKTYGQAYNATRDRNFTWRDLYREGAQALGKKAQVLFVPASWVIAQDPQRFSLLREITQFHGAYDSSKAKRDVPEFRCEVDYVDGVARTFADLKRRGEFRTGENDALYQSMVDKALAFGIEPVEV